MTLHEIIEKLIDDGSLEADKRCGQGYEDAKKSIHDDLQTVEDVEVACHHEAGHWAYTVMESGWLGIDPADVRVVGPTIKYDSSKTDPYDSTPTGLRMGVSNNWKAQCEKDVEAIARIAVAGGESVRSFYGAGQRRGDKDDWPRFDFFCREAKNRLGRIVSDTPKDYWDAAILIVRASFEDQAFKQIVKMKAEKIKINPFGPVFDSRTKEIL